MELKIPVSQQRGIKRAGGALRPLGPMKFSHTSLTQFFSHNTLIWILHLIIGSVFGFGFNFIDLELDPMQQLMATQA